MNAKVTSKTLKAKKDQGQRITCLTAYDFLTAKIIDQLGFDLILVGDSLGMVVLGYENTIPVTVSEMVHHAKAVCRGVSRSMVVVDMPFMSYQESPQQALRQCGRVIKRTGASAVKIEGGEHMASTVQALTEAGIAVLGHIGLTPQAVHQLGGYAKQGKDAQSRLKLKQDALALQSSGAFGLVLECVPEDLAKEVSEMLDIPTIGIGAGQDCDGQILVLNDVIGYYDGKSPSFSKTYVNMADQVRQALSQFKDEIETKQFP